MERASARANRPPAETGWRIGVLTLVMILTGMLLQRLDGVARAAEPAAARTLLLEGKYEEAIAQGQQALGERPRSEEWLGILLDGLMARGRYPEALKAATDALGRSPRSLALRWRVSQVLRSNGLTQRATELVEEIPSLVSQRPWAYREAEDLIAFGRAVLASGADPKEVLDKVYGLARRTSPDLRELFLASGELALEKHDFALAAKHFDEGLKRYPKDADLLYGRAQAFAESDREEAGTALEAALKENPRHVPSLLLVADQRIDAEDYDVAGKMLKQVFAVNPWQPDAWAYTAVIAHLRHEPEAEREARASALKYWTNAPGVPHLIGRKLSQKYRFAEGAALQREALDFEPGYLPAKAQLANDLLRLGDTSEGWDLAQEVHAADAYDVAAYNLATLHDTMASFATLTNGHFLVRMSAHEAEVYGPRVLRLLEKAQTALVPKYGHEPVAPTIVEIFPEQKDFGVRTFGMPDNPGYLGVCFGRVITANSPASSRATPVNWEAVLWHEFCHVITLQLTANKMPRWLSEGISVYEERQANPAWGEQLNPRYREMILEGELTPIARLSAAFLMPKSPVHLQFAYYESSLVIEFLVERYGLEALKQILQDLRDDTFINEAIERRTTSLETLEKDFAAFARARAESLGPDLDWERPVAKDAPAALRELVRRMTPASTTSSNYWVLKEQAAERVEERNWKEAKIPLQQLVNLHPTDTGSDGAYALLARAHRALGEKAEEREILARWAELDGDATDAYLRLMEIASASGDWAEVRKNAERQLAVNPLVPAPYRLLARASEAGGDPDAAIASYRALLRLDPPNPPEIHYQLARLLHAAGDAEARRQVLEALEEAPRHRAALGLLLDLQGAEAPAREARP